MAFFNNRQQQQQQQNNNNSSPKLLPEQQQTNASNKSPTTLLSSSPNFSPFITILNINNNDNNNNDIKKRKLFDPHIMNLSNNNNKRRSSWKNLLIPSYKSRSDEFHKLFCDKIPKNERLIADYACALHREILIQGRIYISLNYIAFYSNIFSWITKLVIELRDVYRICKANTARIIPNAIQLLTTSGEKHIFASFVARDKTYIMMLRLWQNNLSKAQQMNDKEIKYLIHLSYGKDLGMNEEDYMQLEQQQQQEPEELLAEQGQQQAQNKQEGEEEEEEDEDEQEEDQVGGELDESKELLLKKQLREVLSEIDSNNETSQLEVEDETNGEERLLSLKKSTIESASSNNNNIIGPTSNLDDDGGDQEFEEFLNSKAINNSDEENDYLITSCDCDLHQGQLISDEEFDLNVDSLFTLLFTNSKFMRTYMVRRGMTDAIVSNWKRGGDKSNSSTFSRISAEAAKAAAAAAITTSGCNGADSISLVGGDDDEQHQFIRIKQVRQLNYSIMLNHLWAKQVDIEEKQKICQVKTGVYVLKSQTINSGIPYGESFTVDISYCLTRNGLQNKSRMLIYSFINFKKERQNWKLSMVKSTIEKQSYSGVREFISDLTSCIKEYIDDTAGAGRRPQPLADYVAGEPVDNVNENGSGDCSPTNVDFSSNQEHNKRNTFDVTLTTNTTSHNKTTDDNRLHNSDLDVVFDDDDDDDGCCCYSNDLDEYKEEVNLGLNSNSLNRRIISGTRTKNIDLAENGGVDSNKSDNQRHNQDEDKADTIDIVNDDNDDDHDINANAAIIDNTVSLSLMDKIKNYFILFIIFNLFILSFLILN